MTISSDLTIEVDGRPMPCYLSRPAGDGNFPAVIVLEGVYGFDDELRRVADLLAGADYVGLAINYFHRIQRDFSEPFTEEGRRRGEEATASLRLSDASTDVAAARDWLDSQPFVTPGKIATWGFGFGGTVAFATATLRGLRGAIVFYGQNVVSPMPSGEPAPLDAVRDIRTPLLLVYGGQDVLTNEADLDAMVQTLRAHEKRYELQLFPNVGHSFFRAVQADVAEKEAAGAWGCVQSFLRECFAQPQVPA